MERAQTGLRAIRGNGPQESDPAGRRMVLGKPAIEGESPVFET